jgi:hypothetical protein
LVRASSRRRHICSALYSVTTDFKCFPRPPKGLFPLSTSDSKIKQSPES